VSKIGVQPVANRLKLFMQSLYSAAALLVVGLMEIYTLFRWGAIAAPDEQVGLLLANALAIGAGALFTLLLVGIYVPVAIHQQGWLDDLIEEESKQTANLDIPKFLAAHGLTSSPLKLASAIIAPLLTGVITNLAKQIV